MNYKETTEYLFSAMPSFQNVGGDAYKPGLERIEEFCAALDNPHRKYPVVHIAGTNGKGSTSHMLAAILQKSGYRVALFTSPHLKDFRERIRIGAEMISEQEVVDFVAQNRATMQNIGLSFFEMTAAMAFDFFARSNVDVAVVETGLGGRLDATNIVAPILSVITNIAIDHTQYLGDTLQKIATEKAGIIKPNTPVVIGDSSSVADIFQDKAAQCGAELIFANSTAEYELDLLGDYQRKNLVTVLSAVEVLRDKGYSISEEQLRSALSQVCKLTGLRGRWQIISNEKNRDKEPLTICDTGHNVHGLTQVTQQLKRIISDFSNRKISIGDNRKTVLHCVLGFARDKDLRQILAMFPQNAHFYFVRAKVERAFTSAEIAEVAKDLNLRFECFDDVASGLQQAKQFAAKDDVIFVGGSTFVVAEV